MKPNPIKKKINNNMMNSINDDGNNTKEEGLIITYGFGNVQIIQGNTQYSQTVHEVMEKTFQHSMYLM